MTTSRVLLILGVLVLILFGICYALTRRQKDEPLNLKSSWIEGPKKLLMGDSRFQMDKDLSADCRQGSKIVLDPNRLVCKAVIKKSNTGQRIRELTLVSSGPIDVSYVPASKDGKPIDHGAKSVPKVGAKPEDSIKLVFLTSGGVLELVRQPGPGLVILEQR